MRALLALTLALLTLGVSLAAAEEVTRDTYTAAVEPICKANTETNERVLKGARDKVKQGKLAQAGKQFAQAATALKGTYAQLSAVPQPSADASKLAKWLAYVKAEADLFKAAADQLKAGNKTKAQAIVLQLTHNANLANLQVLAFDFDYCELDPSKFS